MTSIAANSANKALADFGAHSKKARVSTAVKRNDQNDDLRSELSYQSSSHLGTSSNFSSVLKNRVGPLGGNTSMGGLVQAMHQHPDLTTLSQNGADPSLGHSMISYEDSIVNAEFNAITEEERARRRKADKEAKMREFMQRTKKAASQTIQHEMQSRQHQQMEAQMKEREKVLKAKEYAKK